MSNAAGPSRFRLSQSPEPPTRPRHVTKGTAARPFSISRTPSPALPDAPKRAVPAKRAAPASQPANFRAALRRRLDELPREEIPNTQASVRELERYKKELEVKRVEADTYAAFLVGKIKQLEQEADERIASLEKHMEYSASEAKRLREQNAGLITSLVAANKANEELAERADQAGPQPRMLAAPIRREPYADPSQVSQIAIGAQAPRGVKLFSISVRALTGKVIHLRNKIHNFTSVALLQAHIQDSDGVPAGLQRLVFRQRQMEPHEMLGSLGVVDGSVIHLVLKMRGC